MTNNNNTINLAEFDFNAFQEDAIAQLKSGQTLTGKDGVLTPLIKKILEAALEGEMEAHLWVKLQKRGKSELGTKIV